MEDAGLFLRLCEKNAKKRGRSCKKLWQDALTGRITHDKMKYIQWPHFFVTAL
jgi:hypothetical protein